MHPKMNRALQTMAGALMCMALVAGAQDATTPAPATAPAAAPAAAPAPPTWSVGAVDFSGLVDGYYSYNSNRPGTTVGQLNQLYNFNDETDQFALAEARLTINHTADPVGVHADVVFGRVNTDINGTAPSTNYLEQAYISWTPAKTHGSEFDFGKFVTSAGAEVIESDGNWNYSRAILFVNAIPYWHLGLRTSTPFTKIWTAGIQVVNGWNDDNSFTTGPTLGITSAVTKPDWTWDLNYYGGPANNNTQTGKKQLIDTTYLWTPQKGKNLPKLNTYINYDYGQNRCTTIQGDCTSNILYRWQGIAGALHYQASGKVAVAGRYEYYDDYQGFTTGALGVAGHPIKVTLQEFTATYEYKWLEGLLMRAEYRDDWANVPFFNQGNHSNTVKSQQTFTIAFIAFFGPKR